MLITILIEDVILNEERTTEQERRAIHEGKFSLLNVKIFPLTFVARKYAQLKKTRNHRSGKQHSVDDDEEDIGMKNVNVRTLLIEKSSR